MVLRSSQILSILEQKREAFSAFDQRISEKRDLYAKAMAQLCKWSSLEIHEKLSQTGSPGALPTLEWDHHQTWQIEFDQIWSNFEESHDWVSQTIQNIPTFAVDGSQIYPSKDISLPIALIQIGWYENHHSSSGSYEKDLRVDVLTPTDLGANTSGEPKERIVNMRRFEMESEQIVHYLMSRQSSPQCLAFLDGALIATFAEPFEPDQQDFYVQCLLKVLRASESCQVPLIAYIDTTYTRDLTSMLQALFDLPDAPQLHDSQILNSYLNWGDRSPFFICARGGTNRDQQGILNSYQEMRNRVGFVYLKTNDNYPARLEVPLWIYEAGLLDWVINLVRCEVIIGRGYPYVIETADQTAVLKAEDRGLFFRLLQDWSQREKLTLRLSRKTISKLQRRRIR